MKTTNSRVKTIKPLIAPNILCDQLPASEKIYEHILKSRNEIEAIIRGEDSRQLIIVGPCSIHDAEAALEYAKLLQALSKKVNQRLLIVMRVYFEKPRTTVGWKGLINDPYLDNSFKINDGLQIARQLLLDINELGLPIATEFVDTIIPQYVSDLLSWVAIGARTIESQVHRTLASGLSMPVGFKNGTSGDLEVAVNAIAAAKSSHSFLSINEHGLSAIVSTTGNDTCHVVLRGGLSGRNYHPENIQQAKDLLSRKKLTARVMIDCSHDNSNKDHRQQKDVVASVRQQLEEGEEAIIGLMLESNLVAGNQQLTNYENLVYGQSITDKCIDWEETEKLLLDLANTVAKCED